MKHTTDVPGDDLDDKLLLFLAVNEEIVNLAGRQECGNEILVTDRVTGMKKMGSIFILCARSASMNSLMSQTDAKKNRRQHGD